MRTVEYLEILFSEYSKKPRRLMRNLGNFVAGTGPFKTG